MHFFRQNPLFQRRNDAGQVDPVGVSEAFDRGGRKGAFGLPFPAGGSGEHVVDHALQAYFAPVLRRIDAVDAVFLQQFDFGFDDDSAAAAENLDVRPPAPLQQVDHVFEELDVAALVGTDGDGLYIFLDGGGDDLLDGAVMAQVNDLGARALENPAHDVDGGVMAVEQTGGGDETGRRPGFGPPGSLPGDLCAGRSGLFSGLFAWRDGNGVVRHGSGLLFSRASHP